MRSLTMRFPVFILTLFFPLILVGCTTPATISTTTPTPSTTATPTPTATGTGGASPTPTTSSTPTPTTTPTPGTTPTPTPSTASISAPTGLTATAGSRKITLTWTGVTGAQKYNIYWLDDGVLTKTTGTKIADITATTYAHTALVNGTVYSHLVTAVNSTGEESVASSTALATPDPDWTLSTVDSLGTNVGEYSSMAIDNADGIHIAYFDRGSARLKYAYKGAGASTFTTEVVDAPGNAGYFCKIAVGPDRKAHISYYQTTGLFGIKYATNKSGAWVTEVIGDTGSNSSIAVDSSGKVYIARFTVAGLVISSRAAGATSWTLDTVDSGGSAACDIAIDRNDKPHIAYRNTTGSIALKYATLSGTTWNKITVDSSVGEDGGFEFSLVVDSGGAVHISYFDDEALQMRYAVKTATANSFNTENIYPAGIDDIYNDIVVDSGGYVHVSWYAATYVGNNNSTGHLSYASSGVKSGDPGSTFWIPIELDATGNVGEHNSIAIDSQDRLHVSYFDRTNGDLKYAVEK